MAAMTMSDMETAAWCIIQIIKDTPDLRNTKLAIAGDMAIRKHLPEYGQENAGKSIDLIVNSSTSASLLRKKLLQHPMSPFTESSQVLYYRTSPPSSASSSKSATASIRAQAIEVRIAPEMLCPFLPSAAKPVHEIKPSRDELPYISLVDLIVFKMDACGLRDSPHSKQQEVRDAAALLELATEHSALSLNDEQLRVVEENLADVLRHSTPDKQAKAWWQARLRGKCDPDARKPATEVLTDLIEGMSLDESGKSPTDVDGTSWSRGLFGRTSSSSSKTSLNSNSSSSPGNFVTSNSPMSPTTPTFPTHSRTTSKDVATPGPHRPRKFSTTPSNPINTCHSRKRSVDYGMPRRHSQVLGSLPNGGIAFNASMDNTHHAPQGRFESTPDDDKLVTGSYL
ncbi:hypothetical protein VP1G_09910 [Cytospora mali]|uniref:Uncharacterized protein n=1 Tax=Cytospora mali TaxID=578113 RepID=A0A194VG84_CYTMA|nr:hypothetical protein VP1G_09910 [Valsa mali var. pyri (nom. inval.)]